ncbi:MAG TPA: Gfo/Idh/MocA family oxidoreductase [Verrucomicrobiales bacterium]|nr:Gfo/Idh/MocA family oxidoreductase [Verrucomicrobiales bacterium]
MKNQKEETTETSLSRRKFIKGSTVAIGGALAATLPIEKSAFAAPDNTLKIALIGCGGRGSGAANQALNIPVRTQQGGIKLVAMADAFSDRLEGSYKSLAARYGKDRVDVPQDRRFVGFNAYKEAIALADVVILATPPGFRPIHFEAAVDAGKHVFMEKPVATDAPGIRKVLAAAKVAKEKNLKVGVGLQRHHQKGYIETMKRLHDGIIGDIVSMRCYWNGGGVWTRPRQEGQTEMEYQMRNWYYFNWLCGDHITEQHIHNLDVINWLKGSYPVSAQGMGGREVRTSKEHGEIFDHHYVEFLYADGSRCNSQCRHIKGCWNSVSEHATGTKGRVDIGGYRIRDLSGNSIWRHRGRNDADAYQQEHDDLFAAIRNDTPYNEAEYGAFSTMTSIMGRLATYSGKEVKWNDALKSTLSLLPEKFDWNADPRVLPNEDGYYPVAVPGESTVL